jgi:uncharacterized membrane protein YkvI
VGYDAVLVFMALALITAAVVILSAGNVTRIKSWALPFKVSIIVTESFILYHTLVSISRLTLL